MSQADDELRGAEKLTAYQDDQQTIDDVDGEDQSCVCESDVGPGCWEHYRTGGDDGK